MGEAAYLGTVAIKHPKKSSTSKELDERYLIIEGKIKNSSKREHYTPTLTLVPQEMFEYRNLGIGGRRVTAILDIPVGAIKENSPVFGEARDYARKRGMWLTNPHGTIEIGIASPDNVRWDGFVSDANPRLRRENLMPTKTMLEKINVATRVLEGVFNEELARERTIAQQTGQDYTQRLSHWEREVQSNEVTASS